LPYWGIDDAGFQVIEAVDSETVVLTGFAWLLADTSAYGHQPFHATLQLARTRQGLASYTLQFGDAAVGLGRNAAADGLRRSWPAVEHWLFTFTRPSATRSAPSDIAEH